MSNLRASIAGLALAGALMGGLAATPAAAGTTTFTFTGVCDDCQAMGFPPLPEDVGEGEPLYLGHGTLVLNDYVTGPVARSQFVSFDYRSSVIAFSVSQADLGSFFADLSTVPGQADVLIAKSIYGLIDHEDGSTSFGIVAARVFQSQSGEGASWGVFQGPGGGGDGPSINDDIGRQYNWSANAVPEPGTWMLLIAGFGLAGAQLRAARRRRLA